MLRLTRTVDVARRQDEAFDFVADLRNHLTWHRELESAELVGGGPIGPGSEFRTAFRGYGPVHVRLAEYQRPWRLTFAATGKSKFSYEFRFTVRDGGTRIETTVEQPHRGPTWLIAPVWRLLARRTLLRRGRELRAALERRPAPGP
ncbi:MAG: SRPBCC family protein [Gaiellaceae bacterium]